MNLTDNQKMLLFVFILAIVSIVFLEYTRENLGFDTINAVATAAANAASEEVKKHL